MPGTGSTIGTVGGAAAGTAILPGVGTVIGGALGGVIGGLFDGSDTPSAPTASYRSIDPNVGIGQGTYGYTPEEIQAQRDRAAAMGVNFDDLQRQRAALDQETSRLNAEWTASHPPPTGTTGVMGSGAVSRVNDANARLADPRFKDLMERSTALNSQMGQVTGNADMSDPGRFAAMSQSAQNRQGITLDKFGAPTTAAPEFYQMQRQNAPQTFDPGAASKAKTFNGKEFNAQKTSIDPNAGNQDYANYQQARAKNQEVMNSVQDRAMGRGGPSPAELQMKQGQDRAVAQQAALAASGGQMDAAMSRRQAMLGAASIGQKTASDTALLRANEQIAAQNTYGGLNNAQQGADLNARGQSFGQAQSRAANDWQQNLGAAQFGSDQSFRNAQLNSQQSQFNAGQQNQFNLGRAQTMAQQGQFGAQFGLSQEQAMAQSATQQRQFGAQFENQQNQWAAQFGAQQALNQGQLSMQQRAMNDQMTGMYTNQYMNSRGMQQQNAFQDQNAYNQVSGINAGVGINNSNNARASQQFQQQQQMGMLNMAGTAAAGYMGMGGGGSPAPAVANSGFNQSDPNKINFGY